MVQVFGPRSQLDDRLAQRDDDDRTVARDEIRRHDPKFADSGYQGPYSWSPNVLAINALIWPRVTGLDGQ